MWSINASYFLTHPEDLQAGLTSEKGQPAADAACSRCDVRDRARVETGANLFVERSRQLIRHLDAAGANRNTAGGKRDIC